MTWKITRERDPAQLPLDWSETGLVGLDPVLRRRGFGTELLERTLRFELSARTALAYEPTGLRCTIELPITNRLIVDGPAVRGTAPGQS